MTDSGGVKVLSTEAQSVLNEGIGLILSRWTALQAAVENEWGGRDSRRKADLLVSDIYLRFTQSKEPLYSDDLDGILEEGLLSLNTMAEDGSIEEVSDKLMLLHEECLEGNFQMVEQMRANDARRSCRANITQVRSGNDEDDNEDDEDEDDDDNDIIGGNTNDMMVDAPAHESKSNSASMVVHDRRLEEVAEAEDGWTVVSSRRNKGKGR